jgi:iron donor protein CyaY
VDDQEFRMQSDRALSDLNRRLAAAANDYPLEADMSGGALVIEFEDSPGKFVISPNSPVHQIWISALSKSFKLEWNAERGEFAMPGGGQTFTELISSLIEQHLGEKVEF